MTLHHVVDALCLLPLFHELSNVCLFRVFCVFCLFCLFLLLDDPVLFYDLVDLFLETLGEVMVDLGVETADALFAYGCLVLDLHLLEVRGHLVVLEEFALLMHDDLVDLSGVFFQLAYELLEEGLFLLDVEREVEGIDPVARSDH